MPYKFNPLTKKPDYYEAGSGKLIQTVYSLSGAVATGTTTVPWDDTIPQNTEGDQYYSVAITPTSATNYLIITVQMTVTSSATANAYVVALFQDTTANALAAGNQWDAQYNYPALEVFTHIMQAGTTSETTFKVRAGLTGGVTGTLTVNGQGGGRALGGAFVSGIIIQEVTP